MQVETVTQAETLVLILSVILVHTITTTIAYYIIRWAMLSDDRPIQETLKWYHAGMQGMKLKPIFYIIVSVLAFLWPFGLIALILSVLKELLALIVSSLKGLLPKRRK